MHETINNSIENDPEKTLEKTRNENAGSGSVIEEEEAGSPEGGEDGEDAATNTSDDNNNKTEKNRNGSEMETEAMEIESTQKSGDYEKDTKDEDVDMQEAAGESEDGDDDTAEDANDKVEDDKKRNCVSLTTGSGVDAIEKGRNSTGEGEGSSTTDDNTSNGRKPDAAGVSSTAGGASAVATSTPPPPIMKGTLSCDLDQRRHLIRGMWNYENSNVFPPQRFELVRNLEAGEDEKELPKDGEFHGSFSLAYFHTTSKGKQKERSKVIPETGVNIKFTKIDGKDGDYRVDGKGTNQFGIFHINGTATKSHVQGDPTLHVVLRKRYEPAEQHDGVPLDKPVRAVSGTSSLSSRPSSGPTADTDTGPLPEPAKSFPSGVVCLRGKMYKEESHELGLEEVLHRISGMWSSGLDLLLADPDNVKGLCNRFEYEHKSSQPSHSFPLSGRFSGWFDLSNENGSRTRINERDVMLKFRKNNAGYHNVEGKGSNVFGKYSITGTLGKDNVITIFRQFQPRKIKASKSPVPVAADPSTTAPALARRPSTASLVDMKLKLDDVKLPGDPSNPSDVPPITPPSNGTYSAVSRGVLRVNEDGSHSCQGKWAVTREHFTNGQISNFSFRLESHFATDALKSKNGSSDPFPLDSAFYKGSFQLRKQGSRYQTIVDQQVVMKFCRNSQGSFNVHGKGTNAIGEFDLLGTLVMSGKTGGQVELYRMYPPEKLAAPAAHKSLSTTETKVVAAASSGSTAAAVTTFPGPLQGGLQRRESTRTVKLPSRLEDGDPSAQLSRVMDKCSQILRTVRDRDVELGAFFSEPVDPVALGIPTYHQVIKEPMDIRTVTRKLEAGEINSPEDFCRLVRLIFENAMTFNVDPAHSVHQAARTLLVLFNQKFRDVERMVQNMSRIGPESDEKGKKKGKDDKKRKRLIEEPKSLKRRRMEEAQEMAASNASAVAAIVAAAPATNASDVTRSEFNMLLNLIQQLQRQVVQTHTALAELCPGDENDAKASSGASGAVGTAPVPSSSLPAAAPAPALERKTPVKKKSEVQVEAPAPVVDDSKPLSLAEQELLTETINALPPQHLPGVIQIIREAAPVGADEDEIDLEIDQLDTKTQRKLLRHVLKFVKKGKGKGKKKTPVAKTSPPAKKAKPAKEAPKPKPATTAAAPTNSFFAFNKDDSDSDDSDDDDDKDEPLQQVAPAATAAVGGDDDKDFQLTPDAHADDDDNDDDLASGGLAANWNMKAAIATTAVGKNKKSEEDEDDAWGAAREHAAVEKAREAERKAREEKMKAEAEQAKNERLAAAAARGEELRALREEEKEKNAQLKEQREKEALEAAKAAREAQRAQVQSVEQTVDLDAQRDIMKEYEQNFLDKDLGSASPSSDFGF